MRRKQKNQHYENISIRPQMQTFAFEAESIAYVVCQRYGIETGDNSFGYIASWSKDKTLPELQASLKIIRDTASDIISGIDGRLAEMEREENQELSEEREKEEELLTGEGNRYGIYQIVDGTRADKIRFTGMSEFDRQGIKVLREDYQLVYSGMLDQEDTLDTIFEKFNLERPEGFKGHSLSVSDIVLFHENGKNMAHFVDSFGFREVPDFLDLSEERVYSLRDGERPEKYFRIQRSEEGFDYSFYNAEYKLLDGGVITNADQPMANAVRDILGDAKLQLTGRVKDKEALMERVEEVEAAAVRAAISEQKESVSKEAVDGNKTQKNAESKNPERRTEPNALGTQEVKETAHTLPHIEFYVAESEDAHDLGEYRKYPDIESAVRKYQEILDDPRRKYLGNGMGIIFHGDENDIYNNSECCLVLERVVRGDKLNQASGLGEKAEVREALRMLRDAFPDFHYKMPKYEREADSVKMTVEVLAVRIDRLAHDFEPYYYQERLGGQENFVQDITYSLYTGGVKHYNSLLDEVIKSGGSLATEADKLKDQLRGFEPTIPVGKEPVVRVESCDSETFPHEKYMTIGEFDEAIAKLDQTLNGGGSVNDEKETNTSLIQFTVFFPDDGKMQTLRGSIDVGYGNGGFISSLRAQTEDRLTDESWIAYKRGQGQEAYDAFVSGLTNILENVLPHLQTFCKEPECHQECVKPEKSASTDRKGQMPTGDSSITDNDGKSGRKAGQEERFGKKRSIHDRIASNKAKIEKQSAKGRPVKGVELT